MGPTAPPETNLHVEKKFCRDGSQCTSRDELERRQEELLQRLVSPYQYS